MFRGLARVSGIPFCFGEGLKKKKKKEEEKGIRNIDRKSQVS